MSATRRPKCRVRVVAMADLIAPAGRPRGVTAPRLGSPSVLDRDLRVGTGVGAPPVWGGTVQRGSSRIGAILNDRQPFGPVDTESLIDAEHPELDQLFDRDNLIYAQTRETASPSYI